MNPAVTEAASSYQKLYNTNLSSGHVFYFFSPPAGCKVMVIERRKRAISERAYLAEKNIEVLVKLKQV